MRGVWPVVVWRLNVRRIYWKIRKSVLNCMKVVNGPIPGQSLHMRFPGSPPSPPRAQGNRRRGAATAPNQPPDGLIDPWVPPESGPGLQTRPSARTGSPDAFSSRRTGPTCGRRKSSRSESAKQSRFPGAGARALLQASSGHVCNTFVFDKWWSSGAPPRRHEGILEHDSIFSSRTTLTPCARTKSPFSPVVR